MCKCCSRRFLFHILKNSCGLFADKYLENEFVVLFLDMILQKPQVYRHLLLNRNVQENNVFALILIDYVIEIHNEIRFITHHI